MEKLKNFVSTNLIKILVVVIALAIAAVACVMTEKHLSNKGQEQQVAQTTEKYALERADKKSAETEVQSGTVTAHFVDERGEKLFEDVQITGNVGEAYQEISRPEISGYVATGEEPITRAGKFELGNTDVTFVYKKETSEVLVDKSDLANNQINIAFNNTKTKRDYGMKIIAKDENGNVLNGTEFEVGKEGSILRSGKVRNGDFYVGKIAVKNEGKTTYVIEETKAVAGYEKVDGKVNLGIDVTWNEESKKFEISLNNIANQNVKATINENDEIIIEFVNKKIENMYEVELINKTKTELITGGKFKVTKSRETIKEDYTQNGRLYIGQFKINGDGKETYTVYETQTAEGFERVIQEGNPGVVEVTKTFNESTGRYDLSVKYNDIPGFSAVVEGNAKVVIYVEAEKTPDNDYDLAIKKFVSAIDGEETTNREPKVEVVEEEENGKKVKKVKYTQNNEMEKTANEQKVTYTIRTYNESLNNGKGRRIIEYIPDGLVFLPDNETNKEFGWKTYTEDDNGLLIETLEPDKATVVATDYTIDKDIEGFNIETEKEPKYLDVNVVFEVDESKITSEDRIIENKVKIDESKKDSSTGDELNKDNNETTEKIYVKYFDLDVTKYIKEVTVKNSIKETKQDVGESQKGKLIKIDVAKSEVENTTIRVTYGLRVKNIGEIAGYATELVDYIPKDFKLVQDGIWNVKGDKAVTTKLENTLLQPGESAVIEITFDWKLTEDNIGRRINEGKITKYENEFNAKDPTEDNNDKEEMLVQVRTGSVWVFIVIAVLVGLWMVVGIIFLLMRAKQNKDEE